MPQIKYVGFCAGDGFKNASPDFTRGLAYCVDNDADKWGQSCMGVSVVSPERLLEEDKNSIFIYVYSSMYYRDISKQLGKMGFLEGKHYELSNYELFWSRTHKIIFNAAFLTWSGPKDGDYYEFGSYKGTSFIEAYNVISEIDRFCEFKYGKSDELLFKGSSQRLRTFCFDSFEGLPKPSGVDIGGAFSEGDYKCDYDTFMTNIERAGLDMKRVNVIKGWYRDLNQQTIIDYQMNTARIIHIDCDLYESTRDALAFCTSLIADGTVIIFDDWFHFRGHPYKGEQKAFREWQEANPHLVCTEYMREFPYRNSFIVNIL